MSTCHIGPPQNRSAESGLVDGSRGGQIHISRRWVAEGSSILKLVKYDLVDPKGFGIYLIVIHVILVCVVGFGFVSKFLTYFGQWQTRHLQYCANFHKILLRENSTGLRNRTIVLRSRDSKV